MASVGVLGLAARIVDDLEILWCLCRVLGRASPRPSRRRIVRALFRTIADDRLLQQPRIKKRRRQPPKLSDTESDEQPAEKKIHRYEPSTRFLDEIALYPSWRSVARSLDVETSFVPWLLARGVLTGYADLPLPFLPVYRGLLAHPLERLVVRRTGTSSESLATVFWGSWRGAIVAVFFDRCLGVSAAPRLRGLAGADVRLGDALIHARLSLKRLPSAVLAVVAARLCAFLLFGSSKRRKHLEGRLEAYLGLASSSSGGPSTTTPEEPPPPPNHHQVRSLAASHHHHTPLHRTFR